MDYCDTVQVKTGFHKFWTGYVLGSRKVGDIGQSLVRLDDFKQNVDLLWFFDFDLQIIGVKWAKPDVSLKPETLVALQSNGWPASGDLPPIIVIPPVEPPPIVILPEPPPVVTPGYEIIEFERKSGVLPLLVGSWVRNDDQGIVTSPSGTVTKFTTGSKGEYGIGGYEAGYIREAGTYQVKISDCVFAFPTDGKQFVKLAWREVQSVEEKRRLVSSIMPKSKAIEILALLNSRPDSKVIFNVSPV